MSSKRKMSVFALALLIFHTLPPPVVLRATVSKASDYMKTYCSANPECRDKTVRPSICDRKGYCAPKAKSECHYIVSDAGFRAMCLDLHHAARSAIAMATETRGPQTKAAAMLALHYSNELEFLAACHANSCNDFPDLCPQTKDYPDMAQNMIKATMNEYKLDMEEVKSNMDDWFEQEIEHLTKEAIECYSDDAGYSEVARMVRDTMEAIGCARSYYNESGKMTVLVFCNYSEDNRINQPVYVPGEPCSKCPDESKCGTGKLEGLCLKELHFRPEKFYYYAAGNKEAVYTSGAAPQWELSFFFVVPFIINLLS